ncbi:Oidioi.mRNA.OKI2018_I69.chr1.g101.t1.cds [Oikopleura dioica]|uniref:Oidioi.mRNA.OKI2018_I69.chr1.g101.t1.cds n=1 Tax=Oikopleura dioica TaxID=34765 RepID=A0ABN7SR20_OIKDI|nr:Oidioi.mRNA.OKI2018_I69.chr1.g101.t1.cds [Oikopleura dioica]
MPVFDNLEVAPRILYLFLISVIGSVCAHLIITRTLWYYDGRNEIVKSFCTRRSRFAYNLARFFQIFKTDNYEIPKLIRLKADPVKNQDIKDYKMKKKHYNAAWQFYGKMIANLWGVILTVGILTSTIWILIDIRLESDRVTEEIMNE